MIYIYILICMYIYTLYMLIYISLPIHSPFTIKILQSNILKSISDNYRGKLMNKD